LGIEKGAATPMVTDAAALAASKAGFRTALPARYGKEATEGTSADIN
jgi:hypothetical protein